MRAKFFDECRVLGRVGPRQVHLVNDGTTGYSISVRIRRGNRELNTKKKRQSGDEAHYGSYEQNRCHS